MGKQRTTHRRPHQQHLLGSLNHHRSVDCTNHLHPSSHSSSTTSYYNPDIDNSNHHHNNSNNIIADITRPRDIYTFLSLGYLTTATTATPGLNPAASSSSSSVVNVVDWRSRRHNKARGGLHLDQQQEYGRKAVAGVSSGYNNNLSVSSSSTTTTTTSTNPSSWRNGGQAPYVFFDALNNNPKLPSIQKESIKEEGEDEDDDESLNHDGNGSTLDDITKEGILSGCHIIQRKSILNEGGDRNNDNTNIRITQTYIFAPPERFEETINNQYYSNKHVILPKIKPKKALTCGTSKEQNDVTLFPLETKRKQVQIDPYPTEITTTSEDRTADMMNNTTITGTSGHYMFGVRPECLFINNRLGDRNPLLKSSKDGPSLAVPKSSPGLHDLKDYDEYPRVYWELRDSTITQPEDLEADMIDRDLYRLRQISTLKLSTVEKTFQVHQDPFRRWRWKAGEPVFSPRQQQRPTINCRLLRDRRVKDVPIYPQALSSNKPQLKVTISPLKLPATDRTIESIQYQDDPGGLVLLSSSRNPPHPGDTNRELVYYEEISALPHFDTPRDSPPAGGDVITPREAAVEASLESHRRMDDELAGDGSLGKIPIQKLHQLRGKPQYKLAIKTGMAKVDMASLEAYKKEHRRNNAAAKTGKTSMASSSKGLGHSHKLESFRELYASSNNNINNDEETKHLDTNRSQKAEMNSDFENAAVEKDENNGDKNDNDNDNNDNDNAGGDVSPRKKVPAPLSTLLLQPDLSRLSLYPPGDVINSWDVETGTLTSSAANRHHHLPSPVVSDSSATSKERRKHTTTGITTPMKPVKLEVFAERAATQGVINIPTGRITFHKNMPIYKLDLQNYPPSNARQSCQRSTSAGLSLSDGRTTHLTSNTADSHRVRSTGTRGQKLLLQDRNNIPPQSSGADTGVSIRFGQQGHVIVSSSREGRRSR